MSSLSSEAVKKIIESQVLRAISGYQGNLLAVKSAIEANVIPTGNEPGVSELLNALRTYLALNGAPEDDAFLLRYALTVPGQFRGIVPPMLVLESDRGGFSERRKIEAAGQVSRLKEVLELARSFLPWLSPVNSQALQELTDIVTRISAKGSSELIDQVRNLTVEESRELAVVALTHIKKEETSISDLGKELLEALVCFRVEPLSHGIHSVLLEKRLFWPASLYRDAEKFVTQKLLGLLNDADDSLAANHLLLCVAWTRNQLAEESFRGWFQNLPRWGSFLNVPPAEYPPFAGWSLNAKGKRIDLISLRCHRLRPVAAITDESITCLAPSELSCPRCTAQAAVLFDFSSVAEILPQDAPVRVICCLYCSILSPNFVKYSNDGSFEWLAIDETTPRELETPLSARYVALETTECPPFASANVFELDDASTIGGIPMWLQDAEYPQCPGCSERMTFLAQHDNSSNEDEGLYYVFFCGSCQISAVNYQQT